MSAPPCEQEIELRIIGMTCGACASRVERAVLGVEGVHDASVSLMTESAAVTAGGAVDLRERILAAIRDAGYDAEALPGRGVWSAAEGDPRQREQLRRHRQAMILAVGLTLPILGLEHFGHLLAAGHGTGAFGRHLLEGVLLTLLLAGPAGGPILAGGARAFWHGVGNMDLLIALGTSVAYVSSVFGTFAMRDDFVHYHAAAMILALVSIGRYFEARAKGSAAAAIAALACRAPRTARVQRDGGLVELSIEQVGAGDVVVVPPHHAIPTDGVVTEGQADVDESLMTGEPIPAQRGPGDAVLGGTLVVEGTLTLRTTRPGESSAMGRIMRLVADAQRGRTPAQRLADQVAAVFTPLVAVLAVLTFAAWVWRGGWSAAPAATKAAVAVLVVSCPCALGLATPTVILVASGVAALRGILARDAATLEALGRVDRVIWDKTGTLTTGRPTVVDVRVRSQWGGSAGELLRLAASAEQFSAHPIAKAIVAAARRDGATLREPEAFESMPGGGVAATIEGVRVLVGNARCLSQRGIADAGSQESNASAGEEGVAAHVAIDGVAAGFIRLEDGIRPSAEKAVRRLGQLGIESLLLTGDRDGTAHAVARHVGITTVRSEARPEDKVAFVQEQRRAGHRVAMVGDGINDAAALCAADVGIAFATGADVATEAAGINLVGSTPHLVADAVELSRAAAGVIRQNLAWAFGYNVLMIPLAAAGRLPPWVAAGAMMLSSLTVVGNALRLGRVLRRTHARLPRATPAG